MLEIIYIVCTLLLVLAGVGVIAQPAQPRYFAGALALIAIDLVIIGFKLFGFH